MAGKHCNNLIGCLFLRLKRQISDVCRRKTTFVGDICELTAREDGNLASCPRTSLCMLVRTHCVAGAHSNNVIVLE